MKYLEKFKQLSRKDWAIIAGFIFLGLFIRSLHFVSALNFSYDQGFFSMKALEIWKTKAVVMIGPTASLNYEGHYTFQGSVIYYLLMIFLLLGHWDPVATSYIFTVFAVLMCVPLYFGVKFLLDKRAAIFMTACYCFFPLYVDYTRFLWNPNFQFALMPLILLTMGVYKKTKNLLFFFLTAVLLGVILQFHYQLVIVIAGIFGYYFLWKRQAIEDILIFFFGLAIGLLPMIIFEFRNDFYNTRTVLLLLQHHGQVVDPTANGGLPPHYFLTISFFVLLAIVGIVHKKLSLPIVASVFGILLLIAVIRYAPQPAHAFGMVPNWNITDDQKVYKIIQSAGVQNYNIVNLSYDTLSVVQKYFHARDHRDFNFDDYYGNTYLFVISADDKYLLNPAYEVNTFQPSTVINTWNINQKYTLYLLHREKKT